MNAVAPVPFDEWLYIALARGGWLKLPGVFELLKNDEGDFALAGPSTEIIPVSEVEAVSIGDSIEEMIEELQGAAVARVKTYSGRLLFFREPVDPVE